MTSEPDVGGASGRSDEWIWLILILLVAFLVRVWGLGSWDWEEDELYTLRDAKDLGASAVRGGAPGIEARPLYYLLQHVLLEAFPPTRLMMRLLPFLFGMLGVLATWWVARRVFGGHAGLLAAALASSSPWHVYVSQFARYWSLVFLLATLAFGLLLTAVTNDKRREYLHLLAILVLGALTHPTFIFPLTGVVVALHLMSNEGQVGFRWPSRTALITLWIPLVIIGLAGFGYLTAIGRPEALNNLEARGIVPSLRLIPAMIQWMGVPIAGAGIAASLFLVFYGSAVERRWALMAQFGVLAAFVLLLAASFRTGVYSDYGVAVLPLVIITIAGGMNSIGRRLGDAAAPFTVAAGATMVIAVSPELASHLSDGSKFDYRPAFETIRRLGPDKPVFGRIDALQPASAPELNYLPLPRYDRDNRPGGAWFITSQRRWGIREGGPALERFLDRECRLVGAFERPRLDYRLYRVDLHWCGSDPVPMSTK